MFRIPYRLSIRRTISRCTDSGASTDSQVVLSTQSAIFLDHFEPEEILVSERTNGQTAFRRIDAKALSVWLEDYSLGQLWEKNYLGGRPHSDSSLELTE